MATNTHETQRATNNINSLCSNYTPENCDKFYNILQVSYNILIQETYKWIFLISEFCKPCIVIVIITTTTIIIIIISTIIIVVVRVIKYTSH
jgi:hypothetical protein